MYDCSYNYLSRCNNRIRTTQYDEGLGGNIHNCIVDATDYASIGWYNTHPGNVWRCKFTGLRYGVTTELLHQGWRWIFRLFYSKLEWRTNT